jgi:hypothetical protein
MYRSYFVKGGTHRISILQENKGVGSILHITTAWRDRYPPPILAILEDEFGLFTYHGGRLVA